MDDGSSVKVFPAAGPRHTGPPPGDDENMDDWLHVSSESLGSRSVAEEEEDEEEERREQEEGRPPQLRSKLVSAWNSLKYGLSSSLSSTVTQDIIGFIF